MILASTTWYHELFRSFFYFIDSVVYGFIGDVYDLFETVSTTTILSQPQIAQVADRIYDLLAIFMIFKVTLSLITYVVSPDSFNDKSSGIGSLTRNVVLVLALLVLTPYLFNYAFQLQNIVLKDNIIPKLVFGDDKITDDTLNTGDTMAYIAMSAFFTPDTLVVPDCVDLYDSDYAEVRLSPTCAGITYVDDAYSWTYTGETGLSHILKNNSKDFTEDDLDNYIAGVNYQNVGLMFRESLLNARTDDKQYIMSYKYLFSTVIGVVIILLLISFSMDIAVRSIKLSFLQMVSPVPIISYIDPKSGKDGMFKKWYKMCFSTYLSLFIRLFVIYFAIYIIDLVGKLQFTNMLDGSKQTGKLLSLFIIIGALMFAKQLPKILENLGIKLDSSFQLSPLKKINEQTLGGKMLTGVLGGAVGGAAALAADRMIGTAAMLKTNKKDALKNALGGIPQLGSAIARGAIGHKGLSGGFSRQTEVNRRLRSGRINGLTSVGSYGSYVSSIFGSEDAMLEPEMKLLAKNKEAQQLEEIKVQDRIQQIDRKIAPTQSLTKRAEKLQSSLEAIEKFAVDKIKSNKAGEYSDAYREKVALHTFLSQNQGKTLSTDIMIGNETIEAGTVIDEKIVSKADNEVGFYLNKIGREAYLNDLLAGRDKSNAADFDVLKLDYEKSMNLFNDELSNYKALDENAIKELDEAGFVKDNQLVITGIDKENPNSKSIHDEVGMIGRYVSALKRSTATEEWEKERIKNTTTVDYWDENGNYVPDKPFAEAQEDDKQRQAIVDRKKEANKLNREYSVDNSIFPGHKK